MKATNPKIKIEYGDFQTPAELAEQVCRRLSSMGILPEVIIEPTCGTGAFITAAAQAFPQTSRIIGVEINPEYLSELRARLSLLPDCEKVELRQGDFFRFDWEALLENQKAQGNLLLLGNLPWVTNSVQGGIGGFNLPEKKNFLGFTGLDALTGKSNFDISEWMLLRLSEILSRRQGELAFLCKTSVARRLLGRLRLNCFPVSKAALFNIDAARHFSVSVEACLLYCRFGKATGEIDYEVYDDLNAVTSSRTGWRNRTMVRDLAAFDENSDLFGRSDYQWRSGVKHDCADVMELRLVEGELRNGLGEVVNIEDTFLYPLLKGSDVANNRVDSTDRYVLLTQRKPGDETKGIRKFAPKMWAYLESHSVRLSQRKSRIYRDRPRFSIFGVGDYTFAPWKVAICGLYKKPDFQVVGPINGKSVVFDDTVYFLGFETKSEAEEISKLLQSDKVQKLLNAMIFWDEKRPIKSAILNQLKIHNPRIRSVSLLPL